MKIILFNAFFQQIETQLKKEAGEFRGIISQQLRLEAIKVNVFQTIGDIPSEVHLKWRDCSVSFKSPDSERLMIFEITEDANNFELI